MTIAIPPDTRYSRPQPPCRPLPGRAMSTGRGHLTNLASLFAGSDLDDDSDYADDATIATKQEVTATSTSCRWRPKTTSTYTARARVETGMIRTTRAKQATRAQPVAQAICPGTIVTIAISVYYAVQLVWLLLGTPVPIPLTTIPLEMC